MIIQDETLLALCDLDDFNQQGASQQEIRNLIKEDLIESPLSEVAHRVQLDNRFPIFGKEGSLYTREPIDFNWGRNPRKKRVTIPCFDIVAAPEIPGRYFATQQLDFLRVILYEAVNEIRKTELAYFLGLMKAMGEYNEFYPKMRLEGFVTADFLQKATAAMAVAKIRPTTIFAPRAEADGIHIRAAAQELGLDLMEHNETDSSLYIFGEPLDPNLASALIVDNQYSFTVKNSNAFNEGYQKPVRLTIRRESGYLLGQPGVLKIERRSAGRQKQPTPRIQAYVVGEEGADVVSVLE